jgi:hypothetical protein
VAVEPAEVATGCYAAGAAALLNQAYKWINKLNE